jgi:hypothetical protein
MKRPLLILLLGAVLGLAACGTVYWSLTARHRAMLQHATPELAWLRREFMLSDAEFDRIAALHQAYLPRCAELCAEVAGIQARVRTALPQSGALTPEIERLLEDAAQTRLQCQKMMLRHFLEVSRSMSPDQGRRYLAWVQDKTFVMDHERAANAAGAHAGHGPH